MAEKSESIDNPIHEAAKRGETPSLKLHVSVCLCVWLLLKYAMAPTGNMSWLRECLDNKVGINGLDKAGNTALYWASHGGHIGNRAWRFSAN